MNLALLKARLKAVGEEITALLAKDLTDDDLVTVKNLTTESKDLTSKIEALEEAEQVRAAAALPAGAPAGQASVHAAPAQKLSTAEKVGLVVAGLAKSYLEDGVRSPKGAFKCLEEAGYGFVAKEFSDHNIRQRALNSGSAASGGVLVPESMASEIIDILRPTTTFLRAGPRRVPLIGGNYKVPAAASGATAAWRGEGKPAQVVQPTFKDISMSSKFLDTMVPLTNQLIRFSLPDVRAWVEMDMANAMGNELDLAAYYGTGTVNSPKGITKIDGVTRVAQTGGVAPTVAQIEADASALELSMMSKNLPMLGASWIMNPIDFLYLQNLRDGNGNRYYPELQNAMPMWRNKPVYVTTQIPATLGGTTDESELLLVAFGHVMYGEGTTISFSVSQEASYIQNGTTVSAFQNDLTLIKASAEADVDIRYLESVAVLTGVRWGR